MSQILEIFYRPAGFLADLSIAPAKRGPKDTKKEEQREQNTLKWYKTLSDNPWLGLYHMGFLADAEWMEPSAAYLHQISSRFLRKLSSRSELELMRQETELSLEDADADALLDELPFVSGGEFVDRAWISAAWEQLLHCFQDEISRYDGAVAAYFAEYNAGISVAGRVFFHLVESHQEDYPFAFMATYSTRPAKSRKAIHTPLKNALLEFKNDSQKLLSLLSAVAKAADSSALIGGLMESGELFSPLRFTAEEAYTFLKEIPLYEEAGIMCRVPDWWRRHANTIRLSLNVGNKPKTRLGFDAIVDFTPVLTVDGEALTQKQLKEFLKMAEGLVFYKGKWIEINKKKLEAALAALEQAKELSKDGSITLAEAMRLELEVRTRSAQEDIPVTVSNGKWMKQLKEMLSSPASIDELPLEPTFRASLRPYQEQGYRWLDLMARLGFGACLADDMGLGKTVQVIAWLEHYRVHYQGHALLVVPASLIGNWQKEIQRFAPEMPFQILHRAAGDKKTARKTTRPGADENAAERSPTLAVDENTFLCITTYGMLSRLDELAARQWDIQILDEAQAIKNSTARQTKAAKAIPARIRIAMTGTPIENSLGDLWSLFDFLNHGFLGSAKEFGALIKAIGQDSQGYLPLKKAVSPFILRRLKTDKSIIQDLPDKLEMKEYCGLSKKQAALYEKQVRDLETKLQNTDGIERKGLVLATILKLKQICNHPDQYLGLENFKKEDSGKLESLERICATIYEKRERVLVFTQFREMTEPLAAFLENIFERPGLVLHGATPVRQRSAMVERFNGEAYVPFMVLSLKAGGVGLNLTGANHVIHFDRWWNPAVENQATDRAFRIGQTKKVVVHKFLTSGTIEEKIDAMLEEKQKLAGDILSSAGEKWITELSDAELLDLIRLGGEQA